MRATLTSMFLAVACLTPGLSRAEPSPKMTVCHVPPGNPGNAHDIVISENAVPAHLSHGDYLGSCGVSAPPRDCQTFIDGQIEVFLPTFSQTFISVDDPAVESVAVTNLDNSQSVQLLLADGQVRVMVGSCSTLGGLCLLNLDGVEELPVQELGTIEAVGDGCTAALATIGFDD